jgi:hypothetical protein
MPSRPTSSTECWWKENRHMCPQINILVQASKILPTTSLIYRVNPSISGHYTENIILSEKNKWENQTCERVKWLKGAKLEDFKGVLVI